MIMRPDYTFVDGRPTPLGGRMRYRLERQMEFAVSDDKKGKF